MAWRPHGRARVSIRKPEAWAVCDRCGLLYNRNDLKWQYDWRGDTITNIKLLVCTRTCYDKPYEGRRPLKLPADPVPILDPRPVRYAQAYLDEPDPTTVEGLNGILFGE